jgi:hypothetical protein
MKRKEPGYEVAFKTLRKTLIVIASYTLKPKGYIIISQLDKT